MAVVTAIFLTVPLSIAVAQPPVNVVVAPHSNAGLKKPHRASILGKNYFAQVEEFYNPPPHVPYSTIASHSGEFTSVRLSRDGGLQFMDTSSDQEEALSAVRAYCVAQGMLRDDDDDPVVIFSAAKPGDHAEMSVSFVCDLRLRDEPEL